MTVGGVRPPGGARGVGRGWIFAHGIISIILGGLALSWPHAAGAAAPLAQGMIFLAAGIAALASAAGGGRRETRGLDMMMGWIALALGVALAFRFPPEARALALAVVAWLGVRGAAEICWASRVLRHRGPLLAMGATNILLALFLLSTLPAGARTEPGAILAISFLLAGLSAIGMGLGHHRAPRRAGALE